MAIGFGNGAGCRVQGAGGLGQGCARLSNRLTERWHRHHHPLTANAKQRLPCRHDCSAGGMQHGDACNDTSGTQAPCAPHPRLHPPLPASAAHLDLGPAWLGLMSCWAPLHPGPLLLMPACYRRSTCDHEPRCGREDASCAMRIRSCRTHCMHACMLLSPQAQLVPLEQVSRLSTREAG